MILNCKVLLIIDACYSGNWKKAASSKCKIITSAAENETCIDWGRGYGSAFTYEYTHTLRLNSQFIGSSFQVCL
jgi:hypothetical protein